MCGIWALFGVTSADCFITEFNKIQHRGPDAWRMELDNRIKDGCLGFHRLAIVDGLHGMQPMKVHQQPECTLICNGELYNYKTLREEHIFAYETSCDVECILHLYERFGFDKAVKALDGVYAFCLIDMAKKKIFIARDPYGVRPMFRFYSHEHNILALASEAKAITNFANMFNEIKQLEQLPPGTYEEYSYNEDGKVFLVNRTPHFSMNEDIKYFNLVPHTHEITGAHHGIVTLLTEACRKRLMSDRRIGCLLSGGLDSSLVASIVVKLAKENKLPYKIQTFAIGMEGSPDLLAAKKVAKFIGSEHHEVKFGEKDIAECLEKVIYHLESFDITTIRASIGMYLLCKYIQKNTDTVVLFSGEGADELHQGYIYFRDAPDTEAAHEESKRLLSDIHLFDGLRTDRMTSAFSLEVRCPFLDIDFTRYCLALDKEMIRPKNGIEKHLLRSSFAGQNLLPDSILWRPKEAFSDGVADKTRSLFTIIQELINEKVGDDEFEYNAKKYAHCTPKTKEVYYFRKCFDKNFPAFEHFIPYFWMPKWNADVTDPSARYIKHYAEKKKE